MAFVVEDGTGVANANSYCSVAELNAYHLDRGVEISSQYDDTQKQRALVKATDYVELWYGPLFLGRPLTNTQALRWPRTGVQKPGFPCVYLEGVPTNIKNAVNEYALRELITPGSLMPDPVVSDTGLQVDTIAEKVGPIEEHIKYRGSSVQTKKPFPKGDRWMVGLIYGAEGGSYRA